MTFEDSLIALVRDNEFLYNTKFKMYKNVDKRLETWNEIANNLMRPVDECKQRWKSLRDRFVREKRAKELPSGSGATTKKEWEYYKVLEFLIPSITTRKQTGNYKENSTVGHGKAPDYDDFLQQYTFEDEFDCTITTPKKVQKRKAADDDFKNFLNGLSATLAAGPQIDCDEEFMRNMAKRMKPLPEECKIRLHAKILGAINDELLMFLKKQN